MTLRVVNMTYDAINDLITEVLEVEEMMIGAYHKIIKECKNEEVNTILRKTVKDEQRHAENAREILKILKN